MAASGSTSNVAEGFHYETKYVLLCYLGLPPRPPARSEEGASGHAVQEKAVEKTRKMKEQIEEQLKQLEDEISASFPTTGFDRHTSPVFSPANPESTIEDTLAMLGDRVAQVLDTHLTLATQTLLSGQLDYKGFQSAVKEVSSHSEGGWSKVLVPLVLMQALHCKGQPLPLLLSLSERYLVEEEANFIIQEGGWSAVFSLEDVEEPGALIAEDSNDIYILSGEHGREQFSPPESLLISSAGSSGLSSWHTESFPVSMSGHESWAQVGAMEPEDEKSADVSEGVAEERSENNSSNSDIVHVEREDAEFLEEGEAADEGELQESVLSVLGTESELQALREELGREAAQQHVSEAPESLMSLEEQIVILDSPPSSVPPVEPASLTISSPAVATDVHLQQETPSSSSPPIMADAPVDTELKRSLQPSLPVAATPQVLDPEPHSAQPEPVPAPVEPQILRTAQAAEDKSEPPPEAVRAAPAHEVPTQAIAAQQQPCLPPTPAQKPPIVQEPSAPSQVSPGLSSAAAPEQETLQQDVQPALSASIPAQEPPAAPVHTEPAAEPVESSELTALLYGGAALVAIAALVAYGALSLRKKY